MKKELVKAIENTLFNTNEKFKSLEDFSEKALIEYILALSKKSIIIDYTKNKETKDELLLEIIEITRKKMYGHYDINDYKDFLTKKNS